MDIDSKKMESETNINICSVSTSGSIISEAVKQQLTEKEHLKDITTKLVILVEKKKNLDKQNRLLQQERDTIERERANSFADFTKTYEEKLNNLTCEKESVKQKLEVMQRQIDEAYIRRQDVEKKLNQLIKDKDAHAAQWDEAKTILAAEERKLEKITGAFTKLEREKNKLKNDLSSYKKQNTKLTLQKSKLEEKVTSKKKGSEKIKVGIEQLRSKLATKEDLLATKSAEKRQFFEREKANLQIEFEKERMAFQKETSEQYKRDKELWIKESKTKLETARVTLNDTKQKLEENVKVLEDQNEEYQTNVRNLKRTNESMMKREKMEIASMREQSMVEYQAMEMKYKANIASSKKSSLRLEKEKKELELELAKVKESTKRRIEEVEMSIRLHQQENEKMKRRLNQKDSELNKLQQEHVDYFQEINTLQRLIASADDTVIQTVDDKLMNSARPAKKPRI